METAVGLALALGAVSYVTSLVCAARLAYLWGRAHGEKGAQR